MIPSYSLKGQCSSVRGKTFFVSAVTFLLLSKSVIKKSFLINITKFDAKIGVALGVCFSIDGVKRSTLTYHKTEFELKFSVLYPLVS